MQSKIGTISKQLGEPFLVFTISLEPLMMQLQQDGNKSQLIVQKGRGKKRTYIPNFLKKMYENKFKNIYLVFQVFVMPLLIEKMGQI